VWRVDRVEFGVVLIKTRSSKLLIGTRFGEKNDTKTISLSFQIIDMQDITANVFTGPYGNCPHHSNYIEYGCVREEDAIPMKSDKE
jgi:hypothetical protein